MDLSRFDRRPLLVAIAGPNGAGKTTFYQAHLQASGLRYINADVLASELSLEPYTAAELAGVLRQELVDQQESFVFETVFSDPVGDKVEFLSRAARSGYTVLLCFIGVEDAAMSEQRVCMRVAQGGHDVPDHKLRARWPRSLENLQAAIAELPSVLVFDNSDLDHPFRQVAAFEQGQPVQRGDPLPNWLDQALESGSQNGGA